MVEVCAVVVVTVVVGRRLSQRRLCVAAGGLAPRFRFSKSLAPRDSLCGHQKQDVVVECPLIPSFCNITNCWISRIAGHSNVGIADEIVRQRLVVVPASCTKNVTRVARVGRVCNRNEGIVSSIVVLMLPRDRHALIRLDKELCIGRAGSELKSVESCM